MLGLTTRTELDSGGFAARARACATGAAARLARAAGEAIRSQVHEMFSADAPFDHQPKGLVSRKTLVRTSSHLEQTRRDGFWSRLNRSANKQGRLVVTKEWVTYETAQVHTQLEADKLRDKGVFRRELLSLGPRHVDQFERTARVVRRAVHAIDVHKNRWFDGIFNNPPGQDVTVLVDERL